MAALYGWLASAGAASLYLWRGRVARGISADYWSIFLWQGLVYALWAPIGLGLVLYAKRRGLGPGALAGAAALGVPAILLHALFAAVLDSAWSPRIAEAGVLAGMLERLPVSLLVYMVLVGAVWSATAYRRASALAVALEAARSSKRPEEGSDEPLLVSLGSRRVPVPVATVESLGAAGNYVVVSWDGREGLVRSTLSDLERRLDPARFARIHRSTVANLAMVASAASLSDGSWRLTMESGAELVASRTYRDQILQRLGRR